MHNFKQRSNKKMFHFNDLFSKLILDNQTQESKMIPYTKRNETQWFLHAIYSFSPKASSIGSPKPGSSVVGGSPDPGSSVVGGTVVAGSSVVGGTVVAGSSVVGGTVVAGSSVVGGTVVGIARHSHRNLFTFVH